MNNRFQTCKTPHEMLDIVVDEWCDREREIRINSITKLELKNELGRAIGLGNGDDPNAPAKGIYRYCSGETPLSVEKALLICNYIKNYELVQWVGYQAGMIMTHRASIDRIGDLDAADIFDEIVHCLRENTSFIETLSKTYQAKPCFEMVARIEGIFLKTVLQMEKCRLMFRKLIEKMMDPGSQGELWFGFEPKKKRKVKR